MKATILLLTITLIACNSVDDELTTLRQRIDSLEHKVASAYKPGFGDFMSSVQAHHSKLWFAGNAQNWNLASFEIHELMEAIEGIEPIGRKLRYFAR